MGPGFSGAKGVSSSVEIQISLSMTFSVDRRTFLALGLLFSAGADAPAFAEDKEWEAHVHRMNTLPPDAPKVAMLIYPNMVALDLIGPLTIFKIAGFDIHLVWKDRLPLATDVGIPLSATHTFEECPSELDVLFVPGGIMGTTECMNDEQVLKFLADRGSRAKWVTSVCTGGLVLAAAGLLKGYDATTYWAVADLLPLMGARHVDKRVVRDRNRMTGGGVTAGIDFGIALVSQIKGDEAARRIQLFIEYAPEPPFRSGTPAEAGAGLSNSVRSNRRPMDERARVAAQLAGKRLAMENQGQ